MLLSDRLSLLARLGDELLAASETELEPVLRKAWSENKWFTTDHTVHAIRAIAGQMLNHQALTKWAEQYGLEEHKLPTKVIGLVMAGNIPLVGFSDWLAVFVSGQRAAVKLSDKDKVLLPWLVNLLGELAPQSRAYTHFIPEGHPLADFDAVVATGSNNTARYFEKYFAKYPHIIRQNRNSVAVLNGTETPEELAGLAADIHLYFGLGCRNVSKLYVPQGTDIQALADSLNHYPHFAHHDKYRNNYDYNTTLYILNKLPYFANHSLLLREDAAVQSRISSVHYSFYNTLADVETELLQIQDQVQCVVTSAPLTTKLPVVAFGKSQSPGLTDYPDGVDLMAWIQALDSKVVLS